MTQEFDAEKYYMKGSPFGVTDREIETHGMCLEDPKTQCHDSCSKFMKRQCNGAILIRQAGGTTWISRGWFHLRDGKEDV